MAQKKAHEVEAWLARPDPAVGIVLIYGPDRGLVSERARRLAERTGLRLDDPFSVVRLDAAAIEERPGRLLDEARTVPMFAERRLIWIAGAGAQKALADEVAALAAEPSPDALILIEAGDLKKSAPLRTAVEKAGNAMALPCYADDSRGLDALIDEEMGRAGLVISLEARQALKAALGGDRLASRSEIGKLVLYAADKGRIEPQDVALAVGDAAGLSVDNVVDAVLGGRLAEFDTSFARLAASGSPPFLVLSAAMRQFQTLLALRDLMEREGRTAASAIASARPPVFFARRDLMQEALERRSTGALARALQRLSAAVLETRRRPELARAISRQTLMALALEGARRRR